jgi:hypothetical protein
MHNFSMITVLIFNNKYRISIIEASLDERGVNKQAALRHISTLPVNVICLQDGNGKICGIPELEPRQGNGNSRGYSGPREKIPE